MAAWAVRHRDFVKELIIDQGFNEEWVVVSRLVHEDVFFLCASCIHFVLLGQPQCAETSTVSADNTQALGPWLTAVESITTGERSSVQDWYWVMMGMTSLTKLDLGISLRNMRLILLTKLTQLTSLSLNMSVDSDRAEDEDEGWVDPDALCPLSALRQLRELRVVYSSVPHIPRGVLNLSNLVYLEFHTLRDPASVAVPSLTRLTQLQALVLRGTAVDMRTLTLDSGLTRLVNLQVLMVNSWPVRNLTFTNNFAAFYMSCLQVLDLSLPDGSRMPTHWLASMHQLRVLAVCSSTLAGALPAHTVPLLKLLSYLRT